MFYFVLYIASRLIFNPIFSRLDWRSGQWQRSRIALKDPFNTMLSILLRLFYESKPDWLMKLVEQGKETIQHEESSERAEVSITCLVWYTSSNIDTPNLCKSFFGGSFISIFLPLLL